MKAGMIEHVNMTVRDPQATAHRLGEVFGWKIRWQGPSIHDGYTVHVGTDDAYVALYSRPDIVPAVEDGRLRAVGGLNHVAVLVDDLDETERRVVAAGFEPRAHADYEPGRRFYFDDPDGIEYEVVSYS